MKLSNPFFYCIRKRHRERERERETEAGKEGSEIMMHPKMAIETFWFCRSQKRWGTFKR